MLNSLYNKTKTWGPGSCMIAFYFLSLTPIVINHWFGVLLYGWEYNSQIKANYDLTWFLNGLFFSPWVETLLFNVFLTKIFNKLNCQPITTIIGVSIAFSVIHIGHGWWMPFLIFIPALMFQWNYFLYFDKNESVWGFLSTGVLHFLYNFTILVMIPLIYVVLDIYYDVGDLNLIGLNEK
jgi:hypothetical protein